MTSTAEAQRVDPLIPQWESLAALLRDINHVQEQNQTVNEQLWQTRNTVQNLHVQVNRTNAALAQSDLSLRNARSELHQKSMDLENEKTAHEVTKCSLDQKSLLHSQADEGLQAERDMNRNLVALCNKFDFTRTGMDAESVIPEHLKLGTILRENEAMKQALVKQKAETEAEKDTEGRDETVETLEKEKEFLLVTLQEKERELSELREEIDGSCDSCEYEDDDDVQIETAILGKRRKLGE